MDVPDRGLVEGRESLALLVTRGEMARRFAHERGHARDTFWHHWRPCAIRGKASPLFVHGNPFAHGGLLSDSLQSGRDTQPSELTHCTLD